MIWLLAHPPPPSTVSKLDRRHTGRMRKRDNLLTWKGGGEGEEPNHKKAWSSRNYSIFSAVNYSFTGANKQIQYRGGSFNYFELSRLRLAERAKVLLPKVWFGLSRITHSWFHRAWLNYWGSQLSGVSWLNFWLKLPPLYTSTPASAFFQFRSVIHTQGQILICYFNFK